VASELNIPSTAAASSAAGDPFPAMSPSMNPNRSSVRSTKSKKSPPTSRQGIDVPAVVKNAPVRLATGSSDCWIAAATFSSCSNFARSRACRYSRAFSIATAASVVSMSSAVCVDRELSVPRSRLSR
jgi:hypothetical protein